jgi:hypothetical protein
MESCLETAPVTPKKRLVSESEVKAGDEESPKESASRSGIDILDLKSKLEKMGTNVSLAPGGSNNIALGGRGTARLGGQPEAAATVVTTTAAGISVIRNGESFNLANIAEVKLNFDESMLRKQASPARPGKPSCAVRPMMKALPMKPLATVRPLMQAESQLLVVDVDKVGESSPPPPVNGFSSRAAAASTLDMPIATSTPSSPLTNGISVSTTTPPVLKPLASSSSSSSSGDVSSPVPPVAHVAAMQKSDWGTEVEGLKPLAKDFMAADSSVAVAQPRSPVINVTGEKAQLNGDRNRDVAAVGPVGAVVSDAEDVFNADIVCPHGNLRIEERCKQLISRDAWFRLCNYFDRPKTFQFGK